MALNLQSELPVELQYETLRTLFPGKKQHYRRKPINGATFTAGSEIQLQIAKTRNAFIIPNTMCVTFRVAYSGISAGTAGTDGACLISSAYSHFSRQIWKPDNGQPIETIDRPSLLSHILMSSALSATEAVGMSPFLGTGISGFSSFGQVIDNTVSNQTISYAIPLVGWVADTDKCIPLCWGGYELDLMPATLSDFIQTMTATANTNPTGYTISNIEISCELHVMEDATYALFMKSLGGRPLELKTSSYAYSAPAPLPASLAAGVQDINLPQGYKGAKRFIWSCAPSDALEKGYAGVNPNLANYQLLINGDAFPMQPVDCTSCAQLAVENQKSLGSLYSAAHSGAIARNSFNKASIVNYTPEWVAYTKASGTGANTYAVLTGTTAQASANRFFQILDLEMMNQTKDVFAAVSTVGGNNQLRLNIQTALAAFTHNINVFWHYDLVLVFDPMSGTVSTVQ